MSTPARYLFVEGKDDVAFFQWLHGRLEKPSVSKMFSLEGKNNPKALGRFLASISNEAVGAVQLLFILDSDTLSESARISEFTALLHAASQVAVPRIDPILKFNQTGVPQAVHIKDIEMAVAISWIEGEYQPEDSPAKCPVHELEDLLHALLKMQPKAAQCFEKEWLTCVGEDFLSRKELNKMWSNILRQYDLSSEADREKVGENCSWSAVLTRHPDLFDAHSPLLAPYLTFFQTQPTS